MADLHWYALQSAQPHARRPDPIDGILAAHRNCARLSRTVNFFVVDADNEIINVDFKIKLPVYDKDYVHVWRARNPLNGLVYGWGGVKLFPKKLVLDQINMPMDMTTNFPLKIVDIVGSITHFNTSPFDTWRSAFRETVKLSRNDDQESRERLETWCTIAKGTYADLCLRGACEGRDYGLSCDSPEMLMKINDWTWLQERFND